MNRSTVSQYLIYYLAVLLLLFPYYFFGFSVHGLLEWGLGPVFRSVSVVGESVSSSIDFIRDRSTLLNRLRKKQRKNRELLAENRRLMLKVRRNESLRKQLNLQANGIPGKLVPAEIIHTNFKKWERVFRLNKGSRHNIQDEDPVLLMDGSKILLFGMIEEVSSHHSFGVLASDPRYRVGVMIEGIRNREFVARGAGARGMIIANYPRVLSTEIGREVRTAPSSSLVPAGIRVGTVGKIDDSASRQGIGRTLAINLDILPWIPDMVWVVTDDS